MKRAGVLVMLAALAVTGLSLEAQTLPTATMNDPPWLLLELGKRAYGEKNFGQALDYFRTSIARGGVTPEAEMWIGRVFEEEGELDLAETQYQKALADGSQFEIPDQTISILYDLARIYYNTNQYGKYQVTLKQIVAHDKEFSDPKEASTREAMVRVLKTDGLDRLIVLYRLQEKKALLAHSELGEFSYRTGRFSDAITNLTFATITIMTVAIDAFKEKDPEYDFQDTNSFMKMVQGSPAVSGYLAKTNLFRNLYYLAAALYADGSAERAAAIWRTVIKWSPKDVWYRRSVAQLQKPYIEPLLDINE